MDELRESQYSIAVIQGLMELVLPNGYYFRNSHSSKDRTMLISKQVTIGK